MSKTLRAVTLWLWGGFVYYLIEVLWRGYSDPSMFVVGGFCFLVVGAINNFFPWALGFVWQSVIGAAVITAAELISGVALNVWAGLGIWDYSQMPFNFMGQICLPYSLLWVPVSAFAIWLDDYLRWKLFSEQKPQYKLI
ncbi:hypothetical protein FACS1894208_07160 [Clostridia bacterium]|nr:hypothetical protein FACS1894208_07160 [Clostridia bacterium]